MAKTEGDFVIVEHERVTKVIDVGWPHLSIRAMLSGGDIRWIELNWVDNVGNFVANRIQKRSYLPQDLDELDLMSQALAQLILEIREYQAGIDFGQHGPPGQKWRGDDDGTDDSG